MDKAEFVARAPIYYALAIAVALERTGAPTPEFKIRSNFPNSSDDGSPDDPGTLLDRWMIWERAIAWLLVRNMIKIKNDPFGPPIFSQGPDFTGQWNNLIKDESLPFSTYDAAGRSEDWLIPALHSVENHFVNMDMKAEDFDNPDAEWTPIKIDAEDPSVKKAVSSLEDIIEEVRADNGYNATYPHERDYVLEGLQGTLDKFKSLAVSPGYVRIAIERLRMLSTRFAGTLKDVAIAAAKGALIE
ncbi:MAG: hypothetical protein QOJ84_3643, partial [Bradyrhizobium sp.]|nr:hypothetical protein [Bradyrhizobium sp.]